MTRLLDLFVFDLAGTTVVDDGHVLEAFLRTAEAFDLPADAAALKPRMGWHKQRVFEVLLGEAGRETALAPELAQRFELEFARRADQHPLRPTPGARETIERLVAMEIAVAFNTGFSRATADLVLARLGWGGFTSVASDEVTRGRPAPDLIERTMELLGLNEPRRVGVVGDTPADLMAGTAAGCRFVVGVGHGAFALHQLRHAPHTHLVADLHGLKDLIDALD
ncbi:MAG: HAD-IA family hydrolase [Planctomycetes bacterium]|nr:HAD-IA family hydrolase [Planctomycetota bacterium]